MDRMALMAERLSKGEIKESELVKKIYNPFIKYTCTVKVKYTLSGYTKEEKEGLVKKIRRRIPRFFPPRIKRPFDSDRIVAKIPQESGHGACHHIFEEPVGIKPMRVRNGNPIADRMSPALLAETMISVVRYDHPPETVKVTRNKKSEFRGHGPDNKTICKFMSQLTVTIYMDDEGHKHMVLSGVSAESLGIIKRLEAKTMRNGPLESYFASV